MKVFFDKGKIIFILFVLVCLSACVSNKKIAYFQYDEIDQEDISNVYTTVFKPDDLLQITISAEDLEAVRPFNLPAVAFSVSTNSVVGQPQQLSYLIDSKGEIDFPLLGKLKIGGLTREQTIKLLKDKLDPDYVIDPNINIRIANFKINVTGDVQRPGTYTIPNERVTILDAISLAGDLNISGRRDNVLVTREEGDKKVQYVVDLRSNKLFSSPVFYLQQNDNIYVEHNYARIQSASSNTNTSLFISITGLLITIVSLLTR
ncbi:polysaccharide export protein [Polaribacter aestuariivivens]|uniref:Polysaccharide export protein n=1 Tax=Polaribacter aestuariivivens TaxID=2304626 RepID=A0A5S3N6Q6_9FLAO|nr:polysaccharide biosynthesis/export family protein [Polaribacter aestuariivivens]TMM29139.1 polysaccharide export protein [Polaribacter aestuariivivens]